MEKINHREYKVITSCPFCGQAHGVFVNEADYWDWDDGALVQDAFPYLSADDRELLISGCCSQCWDKYFGSDEEPDPDWRDIHGNIFGGEF